ncbi:unnamed protein product [Acanthoscelides obtectus]|nr:unnamed protein product [Acanthoscelides obtectus]CAK1627211.1 hypothetical protein AOBTE_LOCUS4394 [Acanthoscelides obtectus]
MSDLKMTGRVVLYGKYIDTVLSMHQYDNYARGTALAYWMHV